MLFGFLTIFLAYLTLISFQQQHLLLSLFPLSRPSRELLFGERKGHAVLESDPIAEKKEPNQTRLPQPQLQSKAKQTSTTILFSLPVFVQ